MRQLSEMRTKLTAVVGLVSVVGSGSGSGSGSAQPDKILMKFPHTRTHTCTHNVNVQGRVKAPKLWKTLRLKRKIVPKSLVK